MFSRFRSERWNAKSRPFPAHTSHSSWKEQLKMRRMATTRPQLAPHHPPHVMPHLLAAIIAVLSSAAVVVEAVFQGTQVPTNTLLYNATVSLSQSIIYKGQPGVRMACSGTFVDLGGDAATSLVLTAGHCFEGPGAEGSVA